MKKHIILSVIILSALFISVSGCRRISSPAAPAPTATPNVQQTAAAIVTAVGAINATQTEVAAVNTALAIVTMIGEAHATETATFARGTAITIMTQVQQTINATITPSATFTMTAANTHGLTMSPTTQIPPDYNCHITGYLPQSSSGKQFVVGMNVTSGEPVGGPYAFYGITNGDTVEAFFYIEEPGVYAIGIGVDNDSSGFIIDMENPSSMYTCGDYQGVTIQLFSGGMLETDLDLSVVGGGSCFTPTPTATFNPNDQDADGYPVGEDCDDNNAEINPGANEYCDGEDNNCDGQVDNNPVDAQTWFRDADEDNYGDNGDYINSCERPEGYSDMSEDCDDSDSSVYPGAPEICDGRDNDCDGETDEEGSGGNTYYMDEDSDGYGSSMNYMNACSQPPGYVTNSDDCNDSDPAIHPGAAEVCDGIDNDCDGETDEGAVPVWYRDYDSDGFGDAAEFVEQCEQPWNYVNNADDCDDYDGSINPEAEEVCDSTDNNCNGQTDEGLTQNTYYQDNDGDGYGSDTQTVTGCSLPEGFVAAGGDCNDNNNTVYPGATEVCDSEDNDCDGQTDEGVQSVYYRDNDSDGYGDSQNTVQACSAPPGYVNNDDDCNDTDQQINPTNVWYLDNDGDGAGNSLVYVLSCASPGASYTKTANDCDDSDPYISPNTFWYQDSDSDGYGNGNIRLQQCYQPYGYSDEPGDCDDADPALNPAANEVTGNAVDENCNGSLLN